MFSHTFFGKIRGQSGSGSDPDTATQSIMIPTRVQPSLRRTVFVHSSEGMLGYGVPRVAQLHPLGPGSQES